MARAMDPRLAMAHERANPVTGYMVDVAVPDVGQVLRRAADQFLQSPPKVSESPASSLKASPAGALTLNSSAATLASFPNGDDFTSTHIDAAGLSSNQVRGLCWTVDPAFGRAVLRKVTVRLKRENLFATFVPNRPIGLQIYRRDNAGDPNFASFLFSTWEPVLKEPVWWHPNDSSFNAITRVASPDPFFDFTGLNVVLGSGFGPNTKTEYYFVLSIDQGKDNYYLWARDTTTARTISGVGTFSDRQWRVGSGITASAWREDLTIPAAVPTATIEIEHYVASSTAVYALDLGDTPSTESMGRVVFERGVPTGCTATLELSTAGSSGPWVAVTDGDVVTTKQQTYHLRVTMTAPGNQNIAPHVSAIGIRFRTEVDVSAEAIVNPIPHEIDVPWCAAGIGEGSVTVVRTGQRDYRDVATELATRAPVTQLEVDVRVGSRHPIAPRDAWLLLDRATVNNRTPSAGAEQFSLISALKHTKQKIPARAETFSTVHTVTGSSTASGVTTLHVTPDIPFKGIADAYRSQGYYMRVRQSAQAGVESGYVATIYNNTGAVSDLLSFTYDATDNTNVLPNDLANGDTIEIHSARFERPTVSWVDADLADIWWEIFTVWLDTPVEQIGRGDMGQGERAGLPPRVEAIEPGDATAQAKRLVTMQLGDDESAAALLNQISFLLGGATIEVGGQFVFRQIYPLRNASGAITVQPDPVADTFDIRDTIDLVTPTGIEQRMSQLACDYDVDTTAGGDASAAPHTAVSADVEAIAYLDEQPIDEMAPEAIPDDIARWCFNSEDGGLYLASKTTEMVVRATSTGLRVWSWRTTESRPRLVVGDRVAVVTDQYTDYDPANAVAYSGLWSYVLTLVSVSDGGRAFRGWMQSLSDALPIRGGPGTIDVPATTAGLVVTPTPGDTSYSIAWSGSGDITLSIDGGAYGAPPASPIIVARGSMVDHTYAFRAVLGTQTISDVVTIPSLESLTVTPDLTVTQGTPAADSTPFTVSASNPSGGTAPSIVVTPVNCSMDIAGLSYFTAQTVASGTVVTANRPPTTTTEQATLAFDAIIVGGGRESIVVVIPPKLNFGPTLQVNETPGLTSYSIIWAGTGIVTLSIDGGSFGTPPASPITVTRDSDDHSYTFKAIADGQEIRQTIKVPALNAGAGALPVVTTFYSPSNGQYTFAQHTTTDIIDLVWAISNMPGGGSVDLEWALDGGTSTRISGVTSPYSHLRTGTGGHGLDLVNGGTFGVMRYTLFVKDSSGNELAGATLEVQVDHV